MSPHLLDSMRELNSRINDAGERAMEVFHHPYAFAAWHGVGTRPALAFAGRT